MKTFSVNNKTIEWNYPKSPLNKAFYKKGLNIEDYEKRAKNYVDDMIKGLPYWEEMSEEVKQPTRQSLIIFTKLFYLNYSANKGVEALEKIDKLKGGITDIKTLITMHIMTLSDEEKFKILGPDASLPIAFKDFLAPTEYEEMNQTMCSLIFDLLVVNKAYPANDKEILIINNYLTQEAKKTWFNKLNDSEFFKNKIKASFKDEFAKTYKKIKEKSGSADKKFPFATIRLEEAKTAYAEFLDKNIDNFFLIKKNELILQEYDKLDKEPSDYKSLVDAQDKAFEEIQKQQLKFYQKVFPSPLEKDFAEVCAEFDIKPEHLAQINVNLLSSIVVPDTAYQAVVFAWIQKNEIINPGPGMQVPMGGMGDDYYMGMGDPYKPPPLYEEVGRNLAGTLSNDATQEASSYFIKGAEFIGTLFGGPIGSSILKYLATGLSYSFQLVRDRILESVKKFYKETVSGYSEKYGDSKYKLDLSSEAYRNFERVFGAKSDLAHRFYVQTLFELDVQKGEGVEAYEIENKRINSIKIKMERDYNAIKKGEISSSQAKILLQDCSKKLILLNYMQHMKMVADYVNLLAEADKPKKLSPENIIKYKKYAVEIKKINSLLADKSNVLDPKKVKEYEKRLKEIISKINHLSSEANQSNGLDSKKVKRYEQQIEGVKIRINRLKAIGDYLKDKPNEIQEALTEKEVNLSFIHSDNPAKIDFQEAVEKTINSNTFYYLRHWLKDYGFNLIRGDRERQRLKVFNQPLKAFDDKTLWHVLADRDDGAQWLENIITSHKQAYSMGRKWVLSDYFDPLVTYEGMNPLAYAHAKQNHKLVGLIVNNLLETPHHYSPKDQKEIFSYLKEEMPDAQWLYHGLKNELNLSKNDSDYLMIMGFLAKHSEILQKVFEKGDNAAINIKMLNRLIDTMRKELPLLKIPDGLKVLNLISNNAKNPRLGRK